MSGGGTAERGSTGTDFSYLRPCLNGGLAGGGLAGVIHPYVPDNMMSKSLCKKMPTLVLFNPFTTFVVKTTETKLISLLA